MSTLEKAISIATQAHMGQKDKAGAPYILHPLRVMMKMPTENEMITAVLHDVIEDTSCTVEMLRKEGFTNDILEALDCLSRKDSESYKEFIERVKQNPLAIKIKLADLEDNMDENRLGTLTEADTKRLDKYRNAHERLIYG